MFALTYRNRWSPDKYILFSKCIRLYLRNQVALKVLKQRGFDIIWVNQYAETGPPALPMVCLWMAGFAMAALARLAF